MIHLYSRSTVNDININKFRKSDEKELLKLNNNWLDFSTNQKSAPRNVSDALQ